MSDVVCCNSFRVSNCVCHNYDVNISTQANSRIAVSVPVIFTTLKEKDVDVVISIVWLIVAPVPVPKPETVDTGPNLKLVVDVTIPINSTELILTDAAKVDGP